MSEAQVDIAGGEVTRESGRQPGFFKRLLWVVTSPGRLMECLAERPRVLFGLILTAVAGDALYLARMPLYKDFLRKSSLASMDYMESLTGQKITAQMIEDSLPTAVTQGLITTPAASIIVLLFITLIFFAIFKIMGGKGRYKAYLSVTAYSYVIPAIYLLLLIPVSFVTGSLHQDVPLTSLATLAPADMSGTFLFGILKGIDVFSIWNYAVMAIGFTAVSKLKKAYVYGAVAAVFLLGLLIGAASESALGALL